MAAVLADRPFYRRSGGGVTFSGGEPLVQADFVRAGLRASKEAGVGTALETSGHVPWATLESVLPWVDHLLYDVKHVDPEVHRAYTGASNTLIFDNLRKVAAIARRLVIRVPVIPGFNDTPEAISDIVHLAQSLDRVDELHILPYHRMGQAKYDQLDRAYSLKGVLPPSEDQAREWAAMVEKLGLKCRIRG